MTLLLLTSLPPPLNAGSQVGRHNASEEHHNVQQSNTKVFLPIVSRCLTIVGPLTAASWSQFRYDVFGIDSNDHVIQFWYENGWHVADLGAVPADISGGGFAGRITAASWGPGRYDIFGVGRNGHVVQLWYNGAWQWADLGAIPSNVNANSFAGTITAASSGSERYGIFGVDQDHNVHPFWFDGKWHWGESVTIPRSADGGDLPVQIAAASWGLGRYDIFGTASDTNLFEHVFQLWYDGGWDSIDLGRVPSDVAGGHFSGQIAAASSQTGEYAIFGLGWNTHIVQLWYDGAWHWADLGPVRKDIGGGAFVYPSPITAASWGPGRYDVFGVGQNGHIIQFWYDGAWDWADLGLTC